jgi:ribonuclease D
MTIDTLPDPIFISRHAALNRLADSLAREPIVAVDTESNSLYAYREQVCLIQFSTPEKDFLVDPLSLKDLSVLAPVFRNPKIEKIFHAAEYDLMCLKRDFGFEFNNLFDTMLAARILGRDAVGLGSILETEFGVHLEKRYQRANWGKRPLPPHLMAYARLDTHYLIPLRDRMLKDLEKEELLTLACEDFHRISKVQLNGRLPEDEAAKCWRVSGSHELDPQQAAVLLELCAYREDVARSLDRPVFKVINNHTLLAIANETPQDLRELGRLPGMSRGQVERHGRSLLAAVQRGLQRDPIYPPRTMRPSEAYMDRLEGMRRWRKSTAQKMGVKSDVIMPRDLLNRIAEHNPSSLQELGEILHEVPWRLDHFGSQILQVLSRY